MMRQIDALLEEIKPVFERLLAESGDGGPDRGWLVTKRGSGLDVDDAPDVPPHDALRERVDGGADVAAFVSLVPGYSEQVLAQVYATKPPDSDIRRSHVTRAEDGAVTLGSWEYTV
jgi:hypothetical protein